MSSEGESLSYTESGNKRETQNSRERENKRSSWPKENLSVFREFPRRAGKFVIVVPNVVGSQATAAAAAVHCLKVNLAVKPRVLLAYIIDIEGEANHQPSQSVHSVS